MTSRQAARAFEWYALAGTQFTRFTGTQVLRQAVRALERYALAGTQFTAFTGTKVLEKYKY